MKQSTISHNINLLLSHSALEVLIRKVTALYKFIVDLTLLDYLTFQQCHQ